MKIGSIVIHCHEFNRMVEFWQGALHYIPRAPAKTDGLFCAIRTTTVPTYRCRLASPGRPTGIHLDLCSPVRDEEVVQLVKLGTRRYPWKYRPGADFVVLEDPDSNRFCVVERS
jgi:hypothetical protein